MHGTLEKQPKLNVYEINLSKMSKLKKVYHKN